MEPNANTLFFHILTCSSKIPSRRSEHPGWSGIEGNCLLKNPSLRLNTGLGLFTYLNHQRMVQRQIPTNIVLNPILIKLQILTGLISRAENRSVIHLSALLKVQEASFIKWNCLQTLLIVVGKCLSFTRCTKSKSPIYIWQRSIESISSMTIEHLTMR